MSKNVNSSLVVMRLSTVDVATALATGKMIICEEDSNWDSTADVSERTTKCGVYKTANAPGHTISGSGVAVGDVATNEVSAQQLKIWLDAKTPLYFAYKNDTDGGTIADGEVVYATGSGYLSKVTTTSNTGDGMITFDWEFQVSGAIDLTP